MAADRTWTVLWFGRQLFVQKPEALVALDLPERDDQVAAIVSAIIDNEERPKSIRLIFQPLASDLASDMEIAIVKGAKEKNRATLSEKFPELKNRDTAWALSRPRAVQGGSGYLGLLWLDKKGLLPRLRAQLASKGIALVGAWSLASVLETMDPVNKDAGASMAFVVADAGGFFYAALPSGKTNIAFATGINYRTAFANAVNGPLQAMGGTTPSVLVIENTMSPFDLSRTKLGGVEPVRATFEDLFAAARALPLSSAGNFLAKQILIEARYVVYTLTLLLAAAALAIAGAYWWNYKTIANNRTIQATQANEYREQVKKLNANKEQIEKVDAMEKELRLWTKGHVGFLTEVMYARVTDITIRSLSFDDNGFVITGTEHTKVGQANSPFAEFVGKLGWVAPTPPKDGVAAPTPAATRKWTFEGPPTPPVLTTPDFTINGRWVQ